MSVVKNKICEEFLEEYSSLSDIKKNDFSRLCNKLLGETFVYGQKKEDRNDYFDLLGMKKIIQDYFLLMDYELIHIDIYKIFYIQTSQDRNRIRLKKTETVMLLIFRLLYQKKSLEVNSSSDIVVKLEELINEVNRTGIFKNSLSMTENLNALRTLKRYKIINYDFVNYQGDNNITVYPTILFVVKIESVDMLNEKIKTYMISKEEEDDINED